ncbi:MAG: translesion DNA synthesis-associated protein ImuA [Xanthomonadales bacterium]|nr:translesion DNA synthesis-associated protein ImuA [Xanthomonadales bacterium]
MAAVLTSPFTTGPRSARHAALAGVRDHPGIWRRGREHAVSLRTQPTGDAGLDARLPGGGWPRGGLIEILAGHDGLGEMSLLLPAIAALTRTRRRVAMIGPPYIPFAPAWIAAGVDPAHLVQIDAAAANRHWSAEQCLRTGCCAAILHWLPEADYPRLRRLQLAAETGDALAFLLRPLQARRESTPAALRIEVSRFESDTCVKILKCRNNPDLAGSSILSRCA